MTCIFLLDKQHFVLDKQNPNYIENATYRIYLCLNKMTLSCMPHYIGFFIYVSYTFEMLHLGNDG